ncbi:MAG: SDR family NAD(P)-dependent oxidoreductase [Nocardioidaceae bacterium]
MSVSYDFGGKVVVVTGAARGVGREMVNSFIESGAYVVAADRDFAALADTCRDHGSAALAVPADITIIDDVQRVASTAVREFGRLDICVNNAAVAPHTSLLEEDVHTWDTVYAVNCRGTFLMTQATAQAMLNQGHGGRIINFSSGVTRRGSAGAAAYASSRAAVESFTRVAAIELASANILVNCVRPGLIDTQPKPLPPSMAESLEHRIPTLPLARAGEPAEVVQAVLWLSSEGSSYVTGAVIDVDGGAGVGVRTTTPVVDDDPRYTWVREE